MPEVSAGVYILSVMSGNVPAVEFRRNTIGFVLAIIHLFVQGLAFVFMQMMIFARAFSADIKPLIRGKTLQQLFEDVFAGPWWPLVIKFSVSATFFMWSLITMIQKNMFASGNLWLV